jgi:hypothetical protein
MRSPRRRFRASSGRGLDPHGEERSNAARLEPRGHGISHHGFAQVECALGPRLRRYLAVGHELRRCRADPAPDIAGTEEPATAQASTEEAYPGR